jgi:hypothetical protein
MIFPFDSNFSWCWLANGRTVCSHDECIIDMRDFANYILTNGWTYYAWRVEIYDLPVRL